MLKKIARWILNDELNKKASNEAEDVDLLVRKTEADLLIKELKQKIANVKTEITIIDPFPIDDPQYLGKLAEIVRSSEFLFHIYTIKQNLMEKLVTGDENVAVSLQNQLKGIDYLFSSMVRAGRAYVQMMDAHKENMQGAKDE
jgi:hypothetical protein